MFKSSVLIVRTARCGVHHARTAGGVETPHRALTIVQDERRRQAALVLRGGGERTLSARGMVCRRFNNFVNSRGGREHHRVAAVIIEWKMCL